MHPLSIPLVSLVLLAGTGCGSDEGDPITVADTPAPLFRTLSPAESGVTFANTLHPSDSLNIIRYLYYYNGGGVAIGDVNGDGLPDLYFTANQGPDALYLNEGGLRFRENTAAAGLSTAADWSSGASFADVDADGDLDLYVCKVAGHAGLTGHNELYLNDGGGSFTERSAALGLDFSGLSTQAAFADLDGDGLVDCYLLNHSVHDNERFSDTSARRRPDARAGDRLYLQRDGRFVDATAASGIYSSRIGYGLGVALADFDGDRRPDLAVSNDFGENDYLYLNRGEGRFRESAADWFEHTSQFSMGSAVGDLNADGRLDLVTLDMRPELDSVRKSSTGADPANVFALKQRFGYLPQYARNAVQINTGAGFVDLAPQYGLTATDWSWSPVVFDADLDGRADLFVANGIVRRPNDLDYLKFASAEALQRAASDAELAALMPSGLARNRAYRASGECFADVGAAWGLDAYGSTTGAAAADLDLDGDLDLVLNQVNGPAQVLANGAADQRGRRSVTLDLVVGAGYASAMGATVRVAYDGHEQAVAVSPVSGFQSGSVAPVVCGVPDGVDSLRVEVRWPWREGMWRQTVAAGARVRPEVGGAAQAGALPPVGAAPGADTPVVTCGPGTLAAAEAFGEERLLPFAVLPPEVVSVGGTEGGAIHCTAAGYELRLPGEPTRRLDLPGATVQAACWSRPAERGVLLVSTGDVSDPSSWRLDALALAGGQLVPNELPSGLNVPDVLITALVPVAGDAGAGEYLLLAGGRARAGYGLAPESSVWRHAAGSYTRVWSGAELGMVSGAVDVGAGEVLVAATWQPLRTLRVLAGKVELEEVGPAGLWLGVSPIAAREGRDDRQYLVGNLGTNTQLTASDTSPLRLVVADFDGNGRVDPILVQGAGAAARTFFGLDELARQMPMMRKFFTRYLPFSASRFAEMFPAALVARAGGGEATELRSLVYAPGREPGDPPHLTYLPAAGQRGAAAGLRWVGEEAEVRFRTLITNPEIGTPSLRAVRVRGHELDHDQ